ncbi:RfaG Glycosyltransferase [Candidatus Methylopumilus universalis]|uniref:glycosyltransferase n=1 Tax=Candidatus Methylopumilus universalis TaxID=2588536 RepID=UPI003BEF389C
MFKTKKNKKTSSRHILFAIDSLTGRGAEKVVINLGEELLKLGHQVTFIIYEDIIEFDIDSRINVYKLNPLIHKGLRIFSRFTDHKNVNLFNSLLSNIEMQFGVVDLILSSLPRMDRILSLIKSNRVYHIIGNPLSLQSGIRKHKWYKKISRIWHMKRIYDGRQIIGMSYGIGDDLVEYVKVCPASFRAIYNPFDFDQIKTLANKPFELPINLISKDYLLHIGAFTLQQKRQDLLIEAFALSKLKCKLVLLGKGKDEDKIRNLIKHYGVSGRVVLAGFQINPFPWIKHARLFVLSSDYEGFGNVLIEAMILGTPALSTDCPYGPGEIFINDMKDSLVKCGDAKALGKKMREFYLKPPLINEKSLKRFEATTITKEYLEIIP